MFFVLLLLLASAAGVNETLVLTDGSRMEVAGYEVRGNLVVVTTMEGGLRSFLASLVNLEASRRANEGVSPGEGLSAAQLRKAREALELYGTTEVLRFLSAQFLELAEKNLQDYAPARYHEPFLTAAQRTFSTSVIMDAAITRLAEDTSEPQLETLIQKLRTPALQRIVELEKIAASPERIDVEDRYREQLASSSPPAERRALIERIEAVNGSAELGAQAYFTMFATWEEVAKRFFPNAPTHDLVAFRDARVRRGKKDPTGGYVTYRDATNQDLAEYAAFLESPDGQRFMKLFQAAFGAGFEAAYEATVARWLDVGSSLAR